MRANRCNRPAATPVRKKRQQAPRSYRGLLRGLFTAVLGLSLVIGVGWLGVELRDPNTLPLKAVKIEGEFRHLAAAQLELAVAAQVNSGFFAVDVDAVRLAAEALPWVARASVRRVWPDTLRVQVEEHQPLARWGKNALVNAEGERFSPAVETFPEGLPQLSGPEPLRRQMVQQYAVMERAVSALGFRVMALEQDSRRAWRMTLDSGVELRLGRADPYPRLLRFVRAWPQVFAGNMAGLKSVDLRYSNGFAVHGQAQQTNQAEQQLEG